MHAAYLVEGRYVQEFRDSVHLFFVVVLQKVHHLAQTAALDAGDIDFQDDFVVVIVVVAIVIVFELAFRNVPKEIGDQ
jgi:hypothetical protein